MTSYKADHDAKKRRERRATTMEEVTYTYSMASAQWPDIEKGQGLLTFK